MGEYPTGSWGVGGGGGIYSRGVIQSDRGVGVHPPPSISWAENTIMTERTQESGHRQFMCSLVCGIVHQLSNRERLDEFVSPC
jgi:hypothetical protein